MSWLWLRSTMIAATLLSGSRSSLRRTGFTRPAASAAVAASRNSAPRWRFHRPARASSVTGTSTAAISAQDSKGSRMIDQFTVQLLLTQPLEQVRDMDLVGFVVARQHVHDDVDAGAVGIHALHRI